MFKSHSSVQECLRRWLNWNEYLLRKERLAAGTLERIGSVLRGIRLQPNTRDWSASSNSVRFLLNTLGSRVQDRLRESGLPDERVDRKDLVRALVNAMAPERLRRRAEAELRTNPEWRDFHKARDRDGRLKDPPPSKMRVAVFVEKVLRVLLAPLLRDFRMLRSKLVCRRLQRIILFFTTRQYLEGSMSPLSAADTGRRRPALRTLCAHLYKF
jgi:hypothetical protein